MPFIISCNHAPPSSPLFPYTTLFRSSEVQQALRTNNVLSAVGATKGSMMLLDLKALTDLNSPEQFENIVLRHQDNRSEEHTSELQSRGHLVCRLLLEKKKL